LHRTGDHPHQSRAKLRKRQLRRRRRHKIDLRPRKAEIEHRLLGHVATLGLQHMDMVRHGHRGERAFHLDTFRRGGELVLRMADIAVLLGIGQAASPQPPRFHATRLHMERAQQRLLRLLQMDDLIERHPQLEIRACAVYLQVAAAHADRMAHRHRGQRKY
jgi:hypothetical protein